MRAILTYHSIDPSGSPISVDPGSFRRHVEWLSSGRVRVVPLAELLRLPTAADAVALTFDDAFANFGEIAAPLLLEHDIPVTLFVVTGHVGGTNAWGGRTDPRVPTLPLLDWDALGRLAERGVTLGDHTATHPHLSQLPAEGLENELDRSAERMETETGRRPDEFAYPYGDVTDVVAAAVARVFVRACTTVLRPLTASDAPLFLPRLDMFYFREPGQLEAWGTAAFHGRLWVRAQARRLRTALAPLGRTW